MEALQVKIVDDKVHIDYNSIYDLEESFYEEFNLKEYREKLNEFKTNPSSEICNTYGKLKFLHKDNEILVTLSKNGTETQISGKSLSDKFFI